ncbi:hypothetical protein V8E53_010367 [Lactarius tabidus]
MKISPPDDPWGCVPVTLRFEHGGVPIMWGRGIRGGLMRGGDKESVGQAKDEQGRQWLWGKTMVVGNFPGKDCGGKKCGLLERQAAGGWVVMGEAQMCTRGAEINGRLTAAPLFLGPRACCKPQRVWVTAGCGAEPGSRVEGVFRPPGESGNVAVRRQRERVGPPMKAARTPLRTMLAPANSELPRGDGWVTSGLRAVFHKGKVVVRGREGLTLHLPNVAPDNSPSITLGEFTSLQRDILPVSESIIFPIVVVPLILAANSKCSSYCLVSQNFDYFKGRLQESHPVVVGDPMFVRKCFGGHLDHRDDELDSLLQEDRIREVGLSFYLYAILTDSIIKSLVAYTIKSGIILSSRFHPPLSIMWHFWW